MKLPIVTKLHETKDLSFHEVMYAHPCGCMGKVQGINPHVLHKIGVRRIKTLCAKCEVTSG